MKKNSILIIVLFLCYRGYSQIYLIQQNPYSSIKHSNHYYGVNDEEYFYPLFSTNWRKPKIKFYRWTFYNDTKDDYEIYLNTSNSPYLNNEESKTYDLNSKCAPECRSFYEYKVYGLEEGLLSGHRPCTSGYIIGRYRNKRTNEVTSIKELVKIGSYKRILKWGDFSNIKGRYHDEVSITNHNTSQYVYKDGKVGECDLATPYLCKDADYFFAKTSIMDSKLIARKISIRVKPSIVKWRVGWKFLDGIRLGVFEKGPFGLNKDKISIKGNEKASVVLGPNTVLKAVSEEYFALPPFEDFDIQSKLSKNKDLKMNSILKEDIDVFPNPFTNIITIKTEQEIEKWTLVSLFNRIVAEGNTKTIKTINLANGIYSLRVKCNSGKVVIKKIIKE